MTTEPTYPTPPVLDEDQKKRLRHRNLAVAAVCVAMIVMFYAITLYKGVPLLANRAL